MASVTFEGGQGHLTAYLTGEIDHHEADLLRQPQSGDVGTPDIRETIELRSSPVLHPHTTEEARLPREVGRTDDEFAPVCRAVLTGDFNTALGNIITWREANNHRRCRVDFSQVHNTGKRRLKRRQVFTGTGIQDLRSRRQWDFDGNAERRQA